MCALEICIANGASWFGGPDILEMIRISWNYNSSLKMPFHVESCKGNVRDRNMQSAKYGCNQDNANL